MSYRFGEFVLDESSQSLVLRGEIQDVQPRVFELLCYLVKNSGRVVPKDELLDALWPDVIVTESSLQRAASLARRALASGGLGQAIQNYAKRGYRFAVDECTLGPVEPATAAPTDTLGEARNLARNRSWSQAADRFAEKGVAGLDANDLELWSLCEECRGRPAEAIPALTRAVELHIAAGNPDRAGRAAVTIAKIDLERGAFARAEGWLERARAIIAAATDEDVRAYWLWMQSRLAAFYGRTEAALDFASQAHDRLAASEDHGLKALTLVYKGFYLLALGAVGDGARLQNHAAALALSSPVEPMTGSLIYCNILWSCRTHADWERALQWIEGFGQWCDKAFSRSPANCDLHQAEIFCAQGALAQALETVTMAIPKLAEEQAWSLGEGYRVRGDISYMMGDAQRARADYETAYELGWDAEPGYAVLLADRGEHNAALAALDRALDGRTWFHQQRSGVLLAHAARIAARGGETRRAERYLARLAAEEVRWSQPTVRALVAEAKADLLPRGDDGALQLRLLARQIWTAARLDFHAARVRIDLAEDYLARAEPAAAEAEVRAAEGTAQRLGSRRLLDQCRDLSQALRSARAPEQVG